MDKQTIFCQLSPPRCALPENEHSVNQSGVSQVLDSLLVPRGRGNTHNGKRRDADREGEASKYFLKILSATPLYFH